MTNQTTITSPTRDVRRFELTLTILGAVCSAVVTGVLAAENVSTTGKLVGMALGAAFPPLVGAVGPRRPVRVGVAVLMTAVAVFMAYWGGQVFAKVTNTEPPLPTPREIIPGPGPGPGLGPDREPSGDACGDPLVHDAGDLALEVCPSVLTCSAEDSCGPVTVTSIGTAPLRIGSLEFEGDAGSYLTATGCENAVLAKGQECTITLKFFPESAPESATTRLIINQNLPKVPTLVPLEAHGELSVEPNLALGQPSCDLSGLSTDPDGVSGELAIAVPVSATGLPDLSSVQAAVYVDGVEWQIVPVDPNGGEVIRGDYAGPRPGQVLVRVDPDNLVQESESEDENENDEDNVAQASC